MLKTEKSKLIKLGVIYSFFTLKDTKIDASDKMKCTKSINLVFRTLRAYLMQFRRVF